MESKLTGVKNLCMKNIQDNQYHQKNTESC